MSTRADFYVGRGRKSVWVGSISHDAFPDNLQPYFAGVKSEAQFRAALAKVFNSYGEIEAVYGWPWPWKDSATTDNAICFHDGQVWVSHWSKHWAPLARMNHPSRARCRYPDMTRGAESSADGRLRRSFNIRGCLNVKTGDDLLATLLVKLSYGLSRFWLHSHVADGQVRMLEPSSASDNLLFDILDVMRQERASVQELVHERAAKAPGQQDAWTLIYWVTRETSILWQPKRVELQLDEHLPAYFGLPIPAHVDPSSLPKSLTFRVPEDNANTLEGMRLLDSALALLPFVYGRAVAHEVNAMGNGLIANEEVDETPYLADGSTPENRLLARQFAHRMFWQD